MLLWILILIILIILALCIVKVLKVVHWEFIPSRTYMVLFLLQCVLILINVPLLSVT
jgi:hypothetical protein